MKFDVYCDESHPDLFASLKSSVKYMSIGSLWLPSQYRVSYKRELHALRDKHHIGGEFKWSKISPSKLAFYMDIMTWFAAKDDTLRFRAIVVNRNKVNLVHYHQNDQELGFYKFYYQMLHHWILDFNTYQFFCDLKTNRSPERLKTLHQCLDYTNLSSDIQNVQAIRSKESVLIQLADVLTGLTAATLNCSIKPGGAKDTAKKYLEKLLKKPIVPTGKYETKFNIFEIRPGGGW